ncbi:YqgE/AlgH family protein, partial [Mesorhizobium sp. YIM 152430]|uniref:YqgE/AlgH family protein n=1 Tax=Mesorhizobium sp. YIM 152430 TaxID=3031761 RepID=UPI0023D9E68C
MLGHRKGAAGQGFLENQFLIAMPGMQDERFERSVVYLCAHSEEGAMGLIVNQPQQLLFPDLLVQLDVLEEE